MSSNFTIYSCGSMEEMTREDMMGWRDLAEQMLPDVKWLHPTRRVALHETMEQSKYNSMKKIVKQDLNDIKNSDLILANLSDDLGGRRWGSVMEIALAWEWDKTIVTIVDEKQIFHPFIYTMSTCVYHTLEDALESVKEFI